MLALTFQVGRDRVAVDVRRVREVVPRVRLSATDGGPPGMAGVFVYRGRVVPVVDLHKLTGAGDCPPHLSSRIILVPWPADDPDGLVGLLATQVAEVREVPDAAAQPVPGDPGRPGLGPAVPDGDGILRLLDPDRLLARVEVGVGAVPALPPGVTG
jgi:chemotaxis-related protein WspB